MVAPLLLLALLSAGDAPASSPLPPPDYALDEALREGLWLSGQLGGGRVGRDGVVGVGLGVGVETRPFALHLRAPVALRVLDEEPRVDATGAVPPPCGVVRCEEWTEGGALSWDALSRVVDEVRVLRPGDLFHLRGGPLMATLGQGQLVARYTNAADWDRRRSGLFLESQLPWRGVRVEALVGGIASPHELFAARVEARPLLDPLRNEGSLERLLGRMRVGLELAGDATAPVGVATDVRGDVRPGTPGRPLVGGAATLTWPLLEDGTLQLAPWAGASVLTGLRGADATGAPRTGAGIQAGLDLTLELVVVALRGGARVLLDGAGHRSGVFSTLYDVDRRRFLGPAGPRATGVAELEAPGGVGGAGHVEALILDVVRLGARLHADPVVAASEAEVFTELGTDAVHVALRALQRADAASGELVPLRAPIFLVAEGAWAVWSPISLVGRWLRTPRFHPVGGAAASSTVIIDDDVFLGASVDVVLSGP